MMELNHALCQLILFTGLFYFVRSTELCDKTFEGEPFDVYSNTLVDDKIT